MFPDGHRSTYLSCVGGFGQFAFARDIPDIDWVAGSGLGVELDIEIPIRDQGELRALVQQLFDMGWATANASWCIQQANTNWHGQGVREFVEVLQDWKGRYVGLETHDSEEFCYFDSCDGGFYTLTASVAATKNRWVRHARLSFQLAGIPLDTVALRQLCDVFDIETTPYFRPRQSESLERQSYSGSTRPRAVSPIAFVVEHDSFAAKDEEWVVGVVVRNPRFRADASARGPGLLPEAVSGCEHLVCALRSWHSLNAPRKTYRLWKCESTWTSDASVVRPIVDWDDAIVEEPVADPNRQSVGIIEVAPRTT